MGCCLAKRAANISSAQAEEIVIANVERVVMANAVWRSALEEIASVTTFLRNDKPQAKRKIPAKQYFQKLKHA